MKNFKKLRNLEINRLKSSFNKAKQKMMKDNYGKLDYEEFGKLENLVGIFPPMFTLLSSSSLFEKSFLKNIEKERFNYDINEGTLRGFINKLILSRFLNLTLKELKINSKNIEIMTSLLIKNSLKCLGDCKKMFHNAQIFRDNNEIAKNIFNNYLPEDENFLEDKCMVYSSYKSFKTDEAFNNFLKDHISCVASFFELIIVDFFDLYIKFTKDDFVAIINGFTIKVPFKVVDNTEIINLALEIQNSLKKSYEGGQLKLLKDYIREALNIYNEDFNTFHKKIRNTLHSKKEVERFIESFENGVLFTN